MKPLLVLATSLGVIVLLFLWDALQDKRRRRARQESRDIGSSGPPAVIASFMYHGVLHLVKYDGKILQVQDTTGEPKDWVLQIVAEI
jgi:hypothetical protein